VLVDVAALRRRGIAPPPRRRHQADRPSAVGDLLVDATDKAVWL
jgi:hypothetical protein